MDIIYKVTIEKGWYTFEQRIFKTFYFNDISIANDFIFRLSRLQRQSDCNYGKIQMEQLLNTIVKSTTRTYKQYAKLVLDMGMSGSNYSSLGRFSAMIDNIIEKKFNTSNLQKI